MWQCKMFGYNLMFSVVNFETMYLLSPELIMN